MARHVPTCHRPILPAVSVLNRLPFFAPSRLCAFALCFSLLPLLGTPYSELRTIFLRTSRFQLQAFALVAGQRLDEAIRCNPLFERGQIEQREMIKLHHPLRPD
jgi:hypothetical protein